MDKKVTLTIEKNIGKDQNLRVLVTGNTHPHKELFKSLGMRWGKTPATLDLFSLPSLETGWYKYVRTEEVGELLVKLQEIKELEVEEKTERFMQVYWPVSRTLTYDVTEDYHSNWNGLVYNGDPKYIYVSGKKVPVSEEEAELLQKRPVDKSLLIKYGLKLKEGE